MRRIHTPRGEIFRWFDTFLYGYNPQTQLRMVLYEQTRFPDNFICGAAAASYQIEDAWAADGKVPSVWDAMCEWPGKIDYAESGKVACDHYNRCREDVALMADLSIQANGANLFTPTTQAKALS